MPRGISLHIGVNYSKIVNGVSYLWDPLETCESSAKSMMNIAVSQGFDAKDLIDSQASVEAITKHIRGAAEQLTDGDIFFVSFSGHGIQVADRDGDESPLLGGDSLDEAWCCFDNTLIDDQLAQLWTSFRANVRILVISDSCHSGTVVRGAGIPRRFARQTPRTRQPGAFIAANGLLIGACADALTVQSNDGSKRSPFVHSIIDAWQKIHGSDRQYSYLDFYRILSGDLIKKGKPKPSWYPFGSVDDSFHLEPPFSIEHTIALPMARGTRARKQGDQHQ